MERRLRTAGRRDRLAGLGTVRSNRYTTPAPTPGSGNDFSETFFVRSGIGPQSEKHFCSFGERLGSEFLIGIFSQLVLQEVIDGLPVLAGVDFHALVPGFE